MGTYDFLIRLQGLSPDAVYRHAIRDDPPELDEAAAARALGAPDVRR